MHRIAALVRENAEELARVVVREPGKPSAEAMTIVSDSRYEISAYLFTNDVQRIMRAVQDTRFGAVYVNRVRPESLQGFHTGYRNSGSGDDGIHDLDHYLGKKTIYVNYSGRSPVRLMPW